MTKILKKISVKTVCNKPKAFFKELTGETMLMRVVGIARKYDLGQSTYGEFFAFKGEFQATDLTSGEVSIGATCFMPQPVDGLLKAQIDALGNDGKNPVEFAFDISVIPDESEVGFQYRLHSLVETKQSDPLEALTARFSKVPPKQLAAPEVKELVATVEEVAEAKAAEKVAEKKPVAGKHKAK